MADENDDFHAGLLLKRKDKWHEVVGTLESNGHSVPKFFKDAIEHDGFDIFDNFFFNKNLNTWSFNKKTYSTIESLRDAKIPNYSGVNNNPELVEENIQSFLKMGAIRKSTEADINSNLFTVNPIDLKIFDSKKPRFLLHFKYNSGYRKVQQKLGNIIKEAEALLDINAMKQFDMRHCFLQYKIRHEFTPAVSFELNDCYYTFQVCPFGMSQSSIIANTGTALTLESFSFLHGCFTIGFCDDFLVDDEKDGGFEQYAEGLGMIFKKSKHRVGQTLEFCGYYWWGYRSVSLVTYLTNPLALLTFLHPHQSCFPYRPPKQNNQNQAGNA